MEYEYCVHTWGGFYNSQHEHNFKEGYHYFYTKEERDAYVELLEQTSERLNAKMLMLDYFEGFHTRKDVTLHRVTCHKGLCYHTTRVLGRNYGYSPAEYFMQWKWYPGFNDYPMGEDFDYDDESSYEVIAEWVEGCFDTQKY